jgi:YVTN family beta-propeller protein
MKNQPLFHASRVSVLSKLTFCLVFLGITIVTSACTPRPAIFKPPLRDKGEVILYLQPLPQDSHRFRFRISAITAVASDGAKHALTVDLAEVRGDAMTEGQRRLASAILPPGTYTGFLLSIGEATVQTEEGEVALFVPDEPVTVPYEFKITRRQALALFISFEPEKSIVGGFRFSPVFTAKTFGRQLLSLIGYVSSTDTNTITVFNKFTMEVTDVVATREGPYGIALDQAGQRLYVANSGSDIIEIIDVSQGNIFSKVRLNPGDEPTELALSPDAGTLVAVNAGSRTLSVIDTQSKYELRRISVGEDPTSVVMGPDGIKAYVMNSLSNSISVVEIAKNQPPFTISVDEMPLRGDFNSDGTRLFVITRDSPHMLVIDASSFTVVDRIFVGLGARSIKADARSGLIYIGMNSGGINIVDPRSLMFSDTIPCDGSVEYMTIDSDENTLFALVPKRNKLLKINMISKRVMSDIPLEGGAHAVAVMHER